ncbi:uncharacterized protein LOC127079416 [Lathyrus oleraceus]|uniref:uncharacterized protein LOC127079416 n=1 Tax=Pisum sativum TaxID=3888 RepID=UPI0021CE5D71|nr:uncharacterized protein LOC127079416 [Pisum sativum]
MSQHQTPSSSKTTKPTHKDSTPSMDIHDDEILDVVPLSVIPGEALDLNHHMDASAYECPNQGNSSSIPFSSTHATSSKKDIHHTDRAKRMKTRKGRFVAEMMSAKTAKKTVGVGPSKSWSKVDVKKRKRTIVRKSLVKVVAVHLDNISFHLEDGVAKWKFVIQRRMAVERESGKDVVEVKEVMDLIKNVELMKTVAGLSQCYEGLVKEFIVNIPEDIADKNSKEFCKVFVRGRSIEGAGELVATDNEVCREITARLVKGWPIKKHLPAGKLIVKYAILHKIGSANWLPTNHKIGYCKLTMVDLWGEIAIVIAIDDVIDDVGDDVGCLIQRKEKRGKCYICVKNIGAS